MVITSALHAEGREFDPRSDLSFESPTLARRPRCSANVHSSKESQPCTLRRPAVFLARSQCCALCLVCPQCPPFPRPPRQLLRMSKQCATTLYHQNCNQLHPTLRKRDTREMGKLCGDCHDNGRTHTRSSSMPRQPAAELGHRTGVCPASAHRVPGLNPAVMLSVGPGN